MTALDEGRPSPVAYTRTSPEELARKYLDAVALVQKLALRTRDRYRAALDRFVDFCRATRVGFVDGVEATTVEDFVAWLQGQKRTRNRAPRGKRDVYRVGGIRFILSTCRTAFNWAARRRMLPPFATNPFTAFGVDRLVDKAETLGKARVFTPDQERRFFETCDRWQSDVFTFLATYGLRAGELTHLLVEDVDLGNDSFVIRSKSWLHWAVKTGRERQLPLLPEMKAVVLRADGKRRAGFVFVGKEFAAEPARPTASAPPRGSGGPRRRSSPTSWRPGPTRGSGSRGGPWSPSAGPSARSPRSGCGASSWP
jgi:integrase